MRTLRVVVQYAHVLCDHALACPEGNICVRVEVECEADVQDGKWAVRATASDLPKSARVT